MSNYDDQQRWKQARIRFVARLAYEQGFCKGMLTLLSDPKSPEGLNLTRINGEQLTVNDYYELDEWMRKNDLDLDLEALGPLSKMTIYRDLARLYANDGLDFSP